MPWLQELIPDVETLVALAPEELGRALMSVASSMTQNGMFSPSALAANEVVQGYQERTRTFYSSHHTREVSIALGEAWHWLETNMLIMPAEGMNGSNGWKVFTRRGQQLFNSEGAFRAYVSAAAFPRALLHPILARDVWLEFAAGRYDDAIFKAFRAVEEAVREAGGFSATDIGVPMMRQAFKPENGPLAKMSDPHGEREGLMQLFAGAIQSYKNPHSHRTVAISDIRDAQEMLMLASHLLRIVDDRRNSP